MSFYNFLSSWLFCSLMSQLAGSYRVRDAAPLLTGHFSSCVGLYSRDPIVSMITFRTMCFVFYCKIFFKANLCSDCELLITVAWHG